MATGELKKLQVLVDVLKVADHSVSCRSTAIISPSQGVFKTVTELCARLHVQPKL